MVTFRWGGGWAQRRLVDTAQLAAHAGASVVAVVGCRDRGARLTELGAAEVAVGVRGLTRTFDGALDHVGGRTLAHVHTPHVPGASALSIGMASLQPTVIALEAARIRADGSRIEAFNVGHPFGEDLEPLPHEQSHRRCARYAYLVRLLAAGKLDPQVGWRGSWERASEVVELLLGRRVRGKAVLEVAR